MAGSARWPGYGSTKSAPEPQGVRPVRKALRFAIRTEASALVRVQRTTSTGSLECDSTRED